MRAVVIAHGSVDERDRAVAVDAEMLIAADGGALHAMEWNLAPEIVVGDMDSLDEPTLAVLESAEARLERYPAEKDASDLELAVARAAAEGAREIVILGAFGGPRLDYDLANALLLAHERWSGLDVRAVRGTATARAVRGPGGLDLVGPAVSLLPLTADVAGVRTAGLRYPLDGETLALGTSRGVSNEVASSPARVSLERGVLLVVEDAGYHTAP